MCHEFGVNMSELAVLESMGAREGGGGHESWSIVVCWWR